LARSLRLFGGAHDVLPYFGLTRWKVGQHDDKEIVKPRVLAQPFCCNFIITAASSLSRNYMGAAECRRTFVYDY
jgi:hypothetical protein